jgi:hypothetical protein|eukprot:COSAG06_NODE_1516_length_9225_cov_14.251260_5_plen_64_part_00
MSNLHCTELFSCGRKVHVVPELKIAGLIWLATHCRHCFVQVKHLHVRLATEQFQGCCVVVIDA